MSKIMQYRKKYKTISAVHKFVKAMQVIAMTQLKKNQDKLKWSNYYHAALEEIMHNGMSNSIFTRVPEYKRPHKTTVCLITSSKGYCAGFNENVFERLAEVKKLEAKENNDVQLVVLGKKGREFLRSRNVDVMFSSPEVVDKLSYENVNRVLDFLLKLFIEEKSEKILLIFNSFKSLVLQKAISIQFLPIVPVGGLVDTKKIFIEPDKETVAEELGKSYLYTVLYDAILQSIVGELGRRLITLKEATDNSADILKQLRLDLNKIRQSDITQELAEISSTFETLQGERGI